MHELGNLSESSADRIDAALARLRHGLAVLAAMSPASARIAKDFDELFGSVPGAAGDPADRSGADGKARNGYPRTSDSTWHPGDEM